jgi:Holliday junction resolvase RusA-like endonuclease
MPAIVFKGIPLPPSSNNQYILVRGRGKTFHAPSQELKRFRLAMEFYWAENLAAVKLAQQLFPGHPLTIHASFGFEKSRLLTKKGTFKRLDVSNRLKALHDSVAAAIGIDDCNFVAVSARKYAVQKAIDEQVTVEIDFADFEEML